jgi:hypothetical protein
MILFQSYKLFLIKFKKFGVTGVEKIDEIEKD